MFQKRQAKRKVKDTFKFPKRRVVPKSMFHRDRFLFTNVTFFFNEFLFTFVVYLANPFER